MEQKLSPSVRVAEEGLNGRTTMWDDPFGDYRNGKKQLPVALETHHPIDLMILMLGTNDLKLRFSLDPFVIGEGIASLIQLSQASIFCPKQILLLAPLSLPLTAHEWNSQTFSGGLEKLDSVIKHYEFFAKKFGCGFLDASKFACASEVDGVHMDKENHAKLGKAISDKSRLMLDLIN